MMGPIQYKVVEYLDSHVVDQSQDPRDQRGVLRSEHRILEGDSGYGTIINKLFRPNLSSSGLYPAGIPAISGATNIAFDKDFIKFENYADTYYFGTQQYSNVKNLRQLHLSLQPLGVCPSLGLRRLR
jgi:hypothetical protein